MLTKIQDLFGKWVAAVILAFIVGGFVFWNSRGFDVSTADYAAKVNGDKIAMQEFERDLQQQQAQYQQIYKIDLDDQLRRQIRRSVLERLVQQEALRQRVQSEGYRISDQRLADSIMSAEAFQIDGKFNKDAYSTFLANQGLSAAGFEALQRQQLAMLDLQNGIGDSSFLTPNEFRRYVELANQKRRVGYALFKADDFKSKVEVKDDEVSAYYDQHKDRFKTEEAASLEYIELKRDQVASSIEVSDQDIQDYYDQHKSEYGTPEERHAEHILITKKDGETDEQTKARAEAVLARVKGGEDFAKVAKEASEDPGTAQQGGDLGWIGRGMLAGPFEDALFDMKAGEIRGPVKTDFGYHVIRLAEIRAGKVQPLDEIKGKLRKQIQDERADSLFYDKSNKLADEAFDAYDELESVATTLNVPLKTAERFPRSGDPALFENSAPVVDAVFGPQALETGTNSGLIKLADDDVVVLNVKERFAPEQKPLEAVKDDIRDTLVRQRADMLASSAADAFVAALPKDLGPDFLGGASSADDAAAGGAAKPSTEPSSPAAMLAAEHGGTWVAPEWVERSDANLPPEILAQAFGMPPPDAKVERDSVRLASGGHAVVFVTDQELGKAESMTSAQRDQARDEMAQRVGTGELGGYVLTVRGEAKVRIPDQVLEPEAP
ncbi:MAG TPA: peptidyl-prolyl cis-trans isomerase [Gammaproteobacteria bacterium]|nr:peptidyl-prolyl cis-trans isomerase [Gammaproteobacteria bacterium]